MDFAKLLLRQPFAGPIVTNTYVNTFDTDYPSSSITKVEEKDGKLVVTLSGSDATSGIGTYHIFAFKNGGEAEQVATVTQGKHAEVRIHCDMSPLEKESLSAMFSTINK